MSKIKKLEELVAINKVIEAYTKRKFEVLTIFQETKDPDYSKEFDSLCSKLNFLQQQERELMDNL